MSFAEFIREYQTLIGSVVGSFLAIMSSIVLWSFRNNFEKKSQIKSDKQEVEKIFLMASRECKDSIDNLNDFIDKSKEVAKNNKEELDLVVPAKFNRIFINEERLFVLSKNFHHITSQQIDIAVSAAKKFNSWLEAYEKLPEIFYNNIADDLRAKIISKKDAIKVYSKNQELYILEIEDCLKNKANETQIQLLRPVVAIKIKDRDLEKIMISGLLDKAMDDEAKSYLNLNNEL